jgi:hypothetical protein
MSLVEWTRWILAAPAVRMDMEPTPTLAARISHVYTNTFAEVDNSVAIRRSFTVQPQSRRPTSFVGGTSLWYGRSLLLQAVLLRLPATLGCDGLLSQRAKLDWLPFRSC